MKYYRSSIHELFYYILDEQNNRYRCSYWIEGWRPWHRSFEQHPSWVLMSKLEARLRGLL